MTLVTLRGGSAPGRKRSIHAPSPSGGLLKRSSRVADDDTPVPFFLVVTDHDRGVFALEGPMTDDRAWQSAARATHDHHRRITCGPSGPDRLTPAAEYGSRHRITGVPPGSIMRPRG